MVLRSAYRVSGRCGVVVLIRIFLGKEDSKVSVEVDQSVSNVILRSYIYLPDFEFLTSVVLTCKLYIAIFRISFYG